MSTLDRGVVNDCIGSRAPDLALRRRRHGKQPFVATNVQAAKWVGDKESGALRGRQRASVERERGKPGGALATAEGGGVAPEGGAADIGAGSGLWQGHAKKVAGFNLEIVGSRALGPALCRLIARRA